MIETIGLGLGHGVCMKQQDENPIDMYRLRRQIRIACTDFSDDNNEEYVPRLHVQSSWEPENAPDEIEEAMNEFETTTKALFAEKKRAPNFYNMDKHKLRLLKNIKNSKQLVITASDKNLGPCIMEMDRYIALGLKHHLNNVTNYKELNKEEATLINETNYLWICERFIDNKKGNHDIGYNNITDMEKRFFLRSLCEINNKNKTNISRKDSLQLPYFYLLPKIHKAGAEKPTRPVVSGVSSIMEPLSIWVDYWLQKVAHLCPAYLVDSWHFLNETKRVHEATNHTLVTFDATAMYANINTEHAITCIGLWFELHKRELPKGFPVQLVLDSIERLMSYNVFTFGNRFFIQVNGTAMGTNAGCMYATIYYSYHEETVILHLPCIKFYRRLIDDAFIVFENSSTNLEQIETAMNNYGPADKRLEWKPEQNGQTVHFLDLWVTINEGGRLETSTFQKPVNLYLYRCPFSAQPESILYGLIYGTLHRYYWHNSRIEDFGKYTELFFHRLLDRAHKGFELAPLFIKAAQAVQNSCIPNPTPGPKSYSKLSDGLLFVHLPYHTQNPSRKHLSAPAHSLLRTSTEEQEDLFSRIILAFLRAANIGDLCKRNQLAASVNTKI